MRKTLLSAGLALCLLADLTAAAASEPDPLSAATVGGTLILTQHEAGGAELVLPSGQVVALALPAEARLSSLAALDDGWMVAGSAPSPGGLRLHLLAGGDDGVGRHLLLPTLTLTLVLLGEYMLIMRSSVLDVFGEDYILTARAKGLSTYRIVRHHALRNAMLPMVTLIALNLGFTVSGAIQVEAVYSWPGLGALTVDAVGDRDYPVLQGAFLLLAVAVVVANLAAELIYGWLDPRVSEE